MLILHLLRLVFDFFRTTFQLLTIPAETGCVTNRQQIKFCCESIFHEIIRTSNIDIDNYCRAEFNFELPGTVIEQRTSQFRDKYRTCDNLYCKLLCV